jgi:glutamate synthase (NADPH/NADH) small chain
MGLGAIHKLGVAGEELEGVTNALDFIAGYKSGKLQDVPSRVAVIGAGNTAIDAANAAVRLGASEVHMVYRRGPEQMSAFSFEYEHAKQEGVRFLWHVAPVRLTGTKRVHGLELAHLERSEDGSLVPNQFENFTLAVELVVLAIGQGTHAEFAGGKVRLERGRIVIDRETGQTSNPKFFAGGDCTNGGREVVDAVADGKRAGIGIAVWLSAKPVSLPEDPGGQHGNA